MLTQYNLCMGLNKDNGGNGVKDKQQAQLQGIYLVITALSAAQLGFKIY